MKKKAKLKSKNKDYQDRIQRKKKWKWINDETTHGKSELDGHQTFKIKIYIFFILLI